MDLGLLALSWQIQLSLASGYAAYMIAYSGIRQHHSSTDAVFRSLLFGVVATTILAVLAPLNNYIAGAIAGIITLLVGAIWRAGLRRLLRSIIKYFDISWSDDSPTAWQTVMAENSTYLVSQIAVELTDGTWLLCSRPGDFADAPFAPSTFGLDGDVAFYVDKELDPDGTELVNRDVRSQTDGDRLTYVPASSIKRISIRYLDPSRGVERAMVRE